VVGMNGAHRVECPKIVLKFIEKIDNNKVLTKTKTLALSKLF
jgi:hypothetical protein